MSSTNRGAKRNGFDDYPTPVDAIDLFLEAAPPDLVRAGRWLEPCAGAGRIIERVERAKGSRATIDWHAWEIQQKYRRTLDTMGISSDDAAAFVHMPPQSVRIGDCLELEKEYSAQYFDVAITNPPYNQAMPILLALRRVARTVVLLLRRNFVGSAKRAEYLRDNMPDEYLLPKRPSFVWRHTYWLRCTGCHRRVKVIEDVPAGQPASKSSAYVLLTAGIDFDHDCMGHGHMLLAAEVDSYDPKKDKTKTTTSDSCEYMWAVWTPDSGPVGSTRMLALTSKAERTR